ncbi:hypothetical protein DXT99_23420 [Pontibacter diazotrophicus]|uniref:Uncharacterized protein n=1 Tax=Pontibacter diazotrophicus TaxID=1400979 RepID=A0A3D8L363_9BACT|nr:hypothetical protein [Pontibacter diazotrophicus]RDV11858.1 hypothetical protein DXT99_23420 [Pontibacter diazotrophicus]
MEKEFLIGGLRAAAYYAIGFAIAWAAYLIFGWEYVHAPGIHHLIGFLVLVVGTILLIRRLIRLFNDSSDNSNKGSLLTHLLVVGGFVIYFGVILKEVNEPVETDLETLAESETLTLDKNTKTIIIENGLGDTVFLQVADSVLIDKKNYNKE